MDNPQAYQSLSHAFIPPTSTTAAASRAQYAQPAATAASAEAHEEEEEEEEEDDDDEGRVEEQLNLNQVEPSPKPTSPIPETPSAPTEVKRRPGRPRGSKNRKPRVGYQVVGQSYYPVPPGQTTTAVSGQIPQHPNLNPGNQQYYEFQWRVLNLCGEFYAAAEELVKATSPLVIAQCYQMGPGVKLDPLTMLAESKHVCDALLSNPSQLILNPPPPMYPTLPSLYSLNPQGMPPPSAPVSGTSVITNPQSFSVPLAPQHAAYNPYPVYPPPPPPPGQYTAPYYQYPPQYPPPAGGYYPPPPPPPQAAAPQPSAGASGSVSVSATSAHAASPAAMGNQGAWSDEETERLRKLAEDSKAHGSSGEIEWDWVKSQWGNTRTKHQILIKATNMGLKESSTRAPKRRRENDPEPTPSVGPAAPAIPPLQTPQQTPVITTVSSSPSQSASQPATTPVASPALQNQQRPASSTAKAPGTLGQAPAPAQQPWPMPTVAAVDGNAASPILATAQPQAQGQTQDGRANYYRPRPAQQDSSGSVTSGMAASPQQHAPQVVHHHQAPTQSHAQHQPYGHTQQYQAHQWYNSSGARS